MANKYTRWSPTPYVPLPLNYYQAALMYKEQKTQQAVDNIEAIIAGYGSIQPFGADSQALYDETTAKLRSDVEAVAKQNLDTPSGIRAVNKLINDPNTVDTYEGILMDTLYATKLRKEVEESRKKNPAVNTADIMSMFDKVEAEGPVGDATKFNRNRFRNVSGPTDYLDIRKKLEEGIKDLHADSDARKVLFDDGSGTQYIVDGKVTQLGEDKIRRYVLGKITSDYAVQEQMQKNLRYKGYLVNKTDIDDGIEKLGEAYKESLTDREAATVKGLKDLYGKMTPTEIEVKRKNDENFRYKELNLQNAIKGMTGYKTKKDPVTGRQDWKSNKELAYFEDVETLVNGMDPYAWNDTSYSKLESPLSAARKLAYLNHDLAMKREQEKTKSFLNIIYDAQSWTYSNRSAIPPTPAELGSYIAKNVPELSNVVLNNDGAFEAANYKDSFVDVKGYKEKKGRTFYNKDLYKDGAIITPAAENIPDRNKWDFVETGFNTETNLPVGILVRKGAKPITDKNAASNDLYNKAKKEISDFVTTHGRGLKFNLDNPADVKNALNAIVRYKQETESLYVPTIHDLSSQSEMRIGRIMDNLDISAVYKGSGADEDRILDKTALGKAKAAIREHFKENKTAGFRLQPVSREGRAYDIVDTKEGTFYIESTPDDQTIFSGANAVVQEMLTAGEPIRPLKNGDMYMSFMGVDGAGNPGSHLAGVIRGGSTQKAQDVLAATHLANIKQLAKEGGMSELEAAKTLNKEEGVDGRPLTIKTPKGYVTIAAPVYKHTDPKGKKTYYYTFANMKEFPLMGIRDVIDEKMQEAKFIGRPQRAYDMWPLIDAKMKADAVGTGEADQQILQRISNDFLERNLNNQ